MKRINTSSVLSVLLLLGILVMINLIGVRLFVRADLTSGKIYSLSDASKKIVSEIPDKLVVKAYFSPDLPGQYAGIERYMRDMLEDYRAFSNGHLQYEFIDPGSAEKLEDEAQSFGVPPVTAQAIENDKVEVKRVYVGMVFIYGDKRETIPTVTDTNNLEYEITSLIHRLTTPDQPVLGITSTGTEEQRRTTQRLYEALGRIYDVRPASLDEPIPSDIDGLFVIAPMVPFTDWQKFNLDQFIIRGGKVGMFMNSYQASLQQMQAASPYGLNINDLLNNYGIGLNEDMIIDTQSNMIQITSQQGFFAINQPVRYPYLPMIKNLDKDNVITRSLSNVELFFPSSVDTTLAAQKGYTIEVLMRTSDMSGRKIGMYIQMDPRMPMTPADFNEKGIPVAAVVSGKFTSMFASSGAPERPADPNGGTPAPYDGPVLTESQDVNRLLIVGDGNIALDTYIQNPRQLVFIQNAADWLLLSGDLISIRSKAVPMEPLKQLPDSVRNAVKWANRIGPAVLLIVMGIVLWQIRRVRNKALMGD